MKLPAITPCVFKIVCEITDSRTDVQDKIKAKPLKTL